MRLEGRPQLPPSPPPSSSPPSRDYPHRRPSPPPPLPRGGSARAASAIAALEDLGCSVFLPPPMPAAPAKEAEEAGDGNGSTTTTPVETEKTESRIDPWSGLAAYESQKEEVRLALLPLTHGEIVSGVAAAARKGSSRSSSSSSSSSSAAAAAAPRAVLFEGPPGCGKTSSARAAARLANAPLVVAPLESIVSKWYGEAEQRLAAVFKHSRELSAAVSSSASAHGEKDASSPPPPPPSMTGKGVLLFIDEVDALATSRGEGGMHEATRRVLGTLLRELDGLRERGKGEKENEEEPSMSTGNVVAVLSTNRPGDIDAALASRCAARIFFPLPLERDREEIIALHARHLGAEQLRELARKSGGLSPRDLVDATAAAERAWASRVVGGRAKPGTAPPFEEYKRAVEERAGRRW